MLNETEKLSFITHVLEIMREDMGSLFYSFDKKFYIICNDVFAWGCADLEEITTENINILEECYKIDEIYGDILFCARMRKMRPQNAFYNMMKDNKIKQLLDECGPERAAKFGNPEERK